jgi:hypothetical protein
MGNWCYRIKISAIEIKARNPAYNRFRLVNAGSLICKRNGEPYEFYSRQALLEYAAKETWAHNSKFAGKICWEIEWPDGQRDVVPPQLVLRGA